MLVSHRDDLTVFSRDSVKLGDSLDERSALGPGGPGAILCQRKNRDGLSHGGEYVYPLVAVLKRQVDEGVPRDAATTGQIQPNCPFRITGAWRAVRAVRDAVRAAAAVAAVVREAVPRIIWRSLLRAGPAVLVVSLRLLPPAELREVQGVKLLEEALLHPARPGLEPFGKVRFGCHGSLPATVPVASPP